MREQIAFGREAVAGVLESLQGFTIDPDSSAQVHAIALHATIVELFHSCISMAEANASAGIPIVLRSMYEAVVDLDNLLTDPAYVEHMEAENLKQLCKLLGEADTNPLFKGLGERVDVPARLAEFGQRLGELKDSGVKPLKIEERCKRVGREHEYRSMYGLFCLDTHNNMVALADRHIEELDGKSQVTFFAEPYEPGVRQRLSFAIGFLLGSHRLTKRQASARDRLINSSGRDARLISGNLFVSTQTTNAAHASCFDAQRRASVQPLHGVNVDWSVDVMRDADCAESITLCNEA